MTNGQFSYNIQNGRGRRLSRGHGLVCRSYPGLRSETWGTQRRVGLELAAAFHGAHHGDLVGVLDVGAGGHTSCDAGQADGVLRLQLADLG